MFEVNNRTTRKRCEICSKLIIKTPGVDVFIASVGEISDLFLVFILLTLHNYLFAGLITNFD